MAVHKYRTFPLIGGGSFLITFTFNRIRRVQPRGWGPSLSHFSMKNASPWRKSPSSHGPKRKGGRVFFGGKNIETLFGVGLKFRFLGSCDVFFVGRGGFSTFSTFYGKLTMIWYVSTANPTQSYAIRMGVRSTPSIYIYTIIYIPWSSTDIKLMAVT